MKGRALDGAFPALCNSCNMHLNVEANALLDLVDLLFLQIIGYRYM